MSYTYYNEEDYEESELNFEPIMYEEEILEYDQYNLTSNENRIEIAIDDYIDPDLPITIQKQKKKLDNVYQELKKKKEEERKSLGIPKKDKKKKGSKKNGLIYKKFDRNKKKGNRPESNDRHMKGGWNFDVRAGGEFDNMRKNELAMDGVWRKKATKIKKKKKKEGHEKGNIIFVNSK